MKSAILIVAALGFIAPAFASETVTYTYDAKGRLVKVVHSGTVNNGLTVEYTLDKVDNRQVVTTSQ